MKVAEAKVMYETLVWIKHAICYACNRSIILRTPRAVTIKTMKYSICKKATLVISGTIPGDLVEIDRAKAYN